MLLYLINLQKNSLNSVGFGVGGIQGSSGTTSRGPVSRTWDVKRGLTNFIFVGFKFSLVAIY